MERNVDGNAKSVSSVAYCSQGICRTSGGLASTAYNYLLCSFLEARLLLTEKAFFSFPCNRWSKVSSIRSLQICGPTKNPSLIFALLSLGNFSKRYLSLLLVCPELLQSSSLAPALMCKGGKKTFWKSTMDVCWMFFSWPQLLLLCPDFRDIMRFPSSAVLFTKKTAVLCAFTLEA